MEKSGARLGALGAGLHDSGLAAGRRLRKQHAEEVIGKDAVDGWIAGRWFGSDRNDPPVTAHADIEGHIVGRVLKRWMTLQLCLQGGADAAKECRAGAAGATTSAATARATIALAGEVEVAGSIATDAGAQSLVRWFIGTRLFRLGWFDGLVAVDESPAERTHLLGNAPNPFGLSTPIRRSHAQDGDAELVVYDLVGRRVATLHRGALPAGSHYYTSVFDLVFKDSSNATIATALGLVAGDPKIAPISQTAETFSFPALQGVKSVQFVVRETRGHADNIPGSAGPVWYTGLAEIAFETPEPASLGLLAIGGVMLLPRRRV